MDPAIQEATVLVRQIYGIVDRLGALLAGAVTSDLMLRREARGLAALFEEQVSRIRLHAAALDRGSRLINRLTVAYEPAIKIISLLWNGQGVALGPKAIQQPLPGFLFDMNRFYQALLSRFLRDNLAYHTVEDEHPLQDVIQYDPKFNPRGEGAHSPRPDLVVFRGTRLVAILDAKYRDLWEKPLPTDMLYQLAIYAASHEEKVATILYPTTDTAAKEARINVQDPVSGRQIARVCLRPVVLGVLEEHIMSGHSAGAQRGRGMYADRLALGK